jgi:thioredoxin-like negative regulator of GroEL
MPTRREKLEAMLQSTPDDQTLRYMLAMEFDKQGDPAGAMQQFTQLMQASTPYVPAFLMAGQLLTRLGRTEEARSVFNDGIQTAQAQNNTHAAGEMAGFLASLGN